MLFKVLTPLILLLKISTAARLIIVFLALFLPFIHSTGFGILPKDSRISLLPFPMEILLSSDTTALSYWLNWRFFLCATWVFTSILIAVFMIWKYEGSICSESDKETSRQERAWFLYGEESWKTCVKQIHPIWLMIFRIFAFVLLLVAVTADVVLHGVSLFYYYTQWTFCLVTIYFGFASVLSIYGCFHHHKTCGGVVHRAGSDAEEGLYVPLTFVEADKAVRMDNDVHYQGKNYLQTVAFWGYVFQIMFQMTAGAVVITDSVYWMLMFPFLDIRDYQLNFLTYVAHSLNAILLLGDTALNCLQFPWFRISYFVILTGVYVIFEWVVHACVSMWWPYPFLDLSLPYSPLWYLVVALLHLPCYSFFALLVASKHYLLSRWFPQSYQCLR